MHTETDEEVRASERFNERMRLYGALLSYRSLRPPSNYDSTRGTPIECAKAKTDCAEFKQAMRRQLPVEDFNALYTRVETHCRTFRPFRGRPYKDWLGILQAVWSRALAGELSTTLQPAEYKWTEVSGGIGLSATELAMHGINPLKGAKKVKTPKEPKKTYNTVGVRFLRGHNLHKVYTYKVPKKVKLRLGEEIVVPSLVDGYEANGIAVVVEVHATPQDTQFGINYKFVTGRITPVKA